MANKTTKEDEFGPIGTIEPSAPVSIPNEDEFGPIPASPPSLSPVSEFTKAITDPVALSLSRPVEEKGTLEEIAAQRQSRTAEAVKYGISTTARLGFAVAGRLFPKAPGQPGELNLGILTPDPNFQPQGLVENAVSMASGLLDPANLLLQSLVFNPAGQLSAKLLGTSKTLMNAEAGFLAKNTAETTTKLFDAYLKNKLVTLAGENAAYGAYNATANAISEKKSFGEALPQITAETLAGGLSGATFGLLFTGKPRTLKYKLRDVKSATSGITPLERELRGEFEDRLTEEAKIREEQRFLEERSGEKNINTAKGFDQADMTRLAVEEQNRLALEEAQDIANSNLVVELDGYRQKTQELNTQKSAVADQYQPKYSEDVLRTGILPHTETKRLQLDDTIDFVRETRESLVAQRESLAIPKAEIPAKIAEIDVQIDQLRQSLETAHLDPTLFDSNLLAQKQRLERQIASLESHKSSLFERASVSADKEVDYSAQKAAKLTDQIDSTVKQEVNLNQERIGKILNPEELAEYKKGLVAEQALQVSLRNAGEIASQQEASKLMERTARIKQGLESKKAILKQRLETQMKRLETARTKLIERAEEAQGPGSDAGELAFKLQKNLDQQLLLKLHMKDAGFEGIGADRLIPEITDTALRQVSKVDAAFNAGLISEKSAAALRGLEWHNTMNLLTSASPDTRPQPLGQWLNRAVWANKLDRANGTKIEEVVLEAGQANNRYINSVIEGRDQVFKPAKSLVKQGWSPEEIMYTMQYIESDSAGNVLFDPTPVESKSLRRSTYQGRNPLGADGQVLPELSRIRSAFDQMQTRTGVNKVRGYAPLMFKDLPAGLKGSVDTIIESPSAINRVSGELTPLHEKDIFKVWDRYLKQSFRHSEFNPVLDKAVGEYNKLMLQGNKRAANELLEYMTTVLNLNGKKEAAGILGDKVLNTNRDFLYYVANQLPDSQAFLSQLAHEIRNLYYHTLIGNNPVPLFKQSVQFATMAPAEIGAKAASMATPMLAFSKHRKIVMRLMKSTLSETLPELDEQATLKSKGANVLIKGLRIITGTQKVVTELGYGNLEKANRMNSLSGALYQANQVVSKGGFAGLQEAMHNMTKAEQNLVRQAWQQQGEQAGKEMYALLRTRRINFDYSLANKPAMFSQGAAKYIPFTGFVQGLIENIYKDKTGKALKTFAIRIATPLVMNAISEATTGYKIPGLNPYNLLAAPQLVTGTILPGVSEAIQAIRETGDLGEGATRFAETVTPYGLYKRAERSLKKAGMDSVATAIGAVKVGTNRPLSRGITEDLIGIKPSR